jgi:hypothetical protein
MNVAVASVVPHTLALHVHGEAVACVFKVAESVFGLISPTSYLSANKTLPKVCLDVTHFTLDRFVLVVVTVGVLLARLTG